MYHLNGSLDVVVLTIGTDPEVTTELLGAVNTRAWSTSAFHFDRYFTAPRRPSIGQYIASSSGCVAFVDYDRCPEEAAETSRYLARAFPGKVLSIAVGKRSTSTTILNAMRAGCSEYYAKHSPASALDVVFDRFEASCFTEMESSDAGGTILAAISAKGGVGTTSVAVHLAAFIAERHGKRTLLIDQQQKLGHACVYLGVDGGNYTFAETVRNLKRMDSELLHGFVAHHSSGLEVLSSPDTAADSEPMNPQEFARTLEFLRGEYDYIIVDCDRRQADLLSSVVHAASEVFLIATPQVAPVRDLSRLIDSLLIAEHSADKLKVVINRYNAPQAIALDQIEKALKLPVAVKLPDCPTEMIHAANTGNILQHSGSGELPAALSRWSDRIAGIAAKPAPKQKEQKILSRWRQVMPAW